MRQVITLGNATRDSTSGASCASSGASCARRHIRARGQGHRCNDYRSVGSRRAVRQRQADRATRSKCRRALRSGVAGLARIGSGPRAARSNRGGSHDAGDMILRQRFDGARQALERLSAAIPQDQRSLVGKDALGQWRVVVLLLDADALMQQYRLVEPDDPNAVSLLNEALRIEPNNAIVDEMLSKAHGLLEERRKQAGVVVSALP